MSKHHTGQLVPALEMFCPVIAIVFVYDPRELWFGKQPHELCENKCLSGHDDPPASRVKHTGEYSPVRAVRLNWTCRDGAFS
jgi:hypothetical protein